MRFTQKNRAKTTKIGPLLTQLLFAMISPSLIHSIYIEVSLFLNFLQGKITKWSRVAKRTLRIFLIKSNY